MKCKSTILGFFLLSTLFLSGCFPEGDKGCPEEMLLSFYLDDQYDEGDFDTRIANDVYLSIFKDNQLYVTYEVPYDDIKNGGQYVVDKADGIEGNLELVAWAISRDVNGNEYVPEWTGQESTEERTLNLMAATRADNKFNPVTVNHFIGLLSTRENIDQETIHQIAMNVTTCRVEVQVADLGDTFSSASEAYVEVNGTMDKMNMQRKGTGSPAIVVADFGREDAGSIWWTTGQFGVFPSAEGQTVSVDIYSDGKLIETLPVPTSNLPQGAVSGGLLKFEYTLGQAHYFLTVDGYTHKVVIVGSM